jgi:hypothetical protein
MEEIIVIQLWEKNSLVAFTGRTCSLHCLSAALALKLGARASSDTQALANEFDDGSE